ncbi:outer membrane protein assembly factor BamE [Sphingomonas sp. MMS24-J13]|uniref:outer membrane protein assembly factor BamE n=1 Tax=Sphingomonas sp. MMS24-J13 TaxID=3238686 RepID=UPI00384AA548
MAASRARAAATPLALIGLAALSGCTSVRDHKGYIINSSLIDTVAPGVDTRDSVYKTLGRASLEGQFNKGATWYYVARDTRQLAFSTPHPTSQMLLTIRFAPNGEVASVQKTGLETIRNVSLDGKKTPVLGSNRGFLSELFGNIGTVGGVSSGAPTADNPG